MPITLKANGQAIAVPVDSVVTLRWTKPDGTTSTVSLAVVDRPSGRFVRNWIAGDTDQVGAHFGQVVVTSAGGLPVTYPDDGSQMIWTVFPKLV